LVSATLVLSFHSNRTRPPILNPAHAKYLQQKSPSGRSYCR
jgi:hypothetical protein